MQVSRLVAVAVFSVLPQNLSQSPGAGHPQDVDVVVTAECLQQCEVNLQSDVTFVLLVCSQDAQNHAVWVTVKREGGESVNRLLKILCVANIVKG